MGMTNDLLEMGPALRALKNGLLNLKALKRPHRMPIYLFTCRKSLY
jgi:hypothetical protein